MKRTIFRTFLLLTLLLFCVSSYSQTISHRIDSLINNSSFLNTSEVGILVYDLTSKQELYRYQAEKLYRPASVEKVITSVTALSVLGKDYQIKTGLSYSGYIEGDTLYGDIYVKGDFDPEFMQEDMETMVDAIANMGIHGVKGRLIGDVSMMDSVYWGPGWAWDDTPETFQPYLSPLMLNRGCINVSISPSGGSKANVEIKPESDFYSIDNRTSPAGSYVSATRNWMYNDNTITVSGSSRHKASTSMNIFNTKGFFMHTLRFQLQGKGVFIPQDSVAYENTPADTKGIITVYRDIDEVLKRAKKYLSHKDGQNAIYKFMKSDIGFDSRKFRIVDGCGVSDYNYVSPELIMGYLKYAFSSPLIFHPFYDSLPIAGIDGTLQYRMGKGKTFRNVRAKTGTLTGVCSLAGYVTSPAKHTIAFVIINQNVLKYVSARKFQNEICNILASYN